MSQFLSEQITASEPHYAEEVARRWKQLLSGEFGPTGPPVNASSTAYSNSIVVKSGAGMLFGFAIYSSKTAAQWIQLFDSATIPADGAVPNAIWVVGAGNGATPLAAAVLNVTWTFPGRFFDRGLVLVNSTTGPTKTIGAADTWFDAQYI